MDKILLTYKASEISSDFSYIAGLLVAGKGIFTCECVSEKSHQKRKKRVIRCEQTYGWQKFSAKVVTTSSAILNNKVSTLC